MNFKDRNIPIEINIELTHKCNFKCKHCYINQSNPDILTLKDYEKFLSDASKLGAIKINISGGEIFIRKDLLLEILALCKKFEFSTSIITNASLVDEDTLKLISNLGINKFIISLYGLSDKTYENVTETFSNINKILYNINLIKKYNFNIDIQTMALSNNYEDIKAMEEWCESIGLELSVGLILMARNCREKENLKYALKDENLKLMLNTYNKQLVDSYKNNKEVQTKSMCNAGKNTLCLTPSGDIFPCSNWRKPIGNILNNSLEDIWINNPSNDLKYIRNLKISDFETCSKCTHLNKCSFCPGMNYLSNNNPLIPHDHICNHMTTAKSLGNL